jgi:hypothetical protein
MCCCYFLDFSGETLRSLQTYSNPHVKVVKNKHQYSKCINNNNEHYDMHVLVLVKNQNWNLSKFPVSSAKWSTSELKREHGVIHKYKNVIAAVWR